jgi:hypothetical protein
MTRKHGLLGLLALLCTAAIGWGYHFYTGLERETEWRDAPLKGEAATNPLYATQQLISHLGGKVVLSSPGRVNAWGGDTLMMTSPAAALPPGFEARLKAWVEHGGHLVMASEDLHLFEQPGLKDLLSVTKANRPRDMSDATACTSLRKLEGAFLSPRLPREAFALCDQPPQYRFVEKIKPRSLYASPEGHRVVRWGVGKGWVTVHNLSQIFYYREPLRADHTLLISGLMRLAQGHEVVFVSGGGREESFMAWLWDQAWVALCLMLLALALAWWRGARRFGPMLPPEPLARRSMREQIRGSGRFVCREGGAVLHRAVLRALEDVAVKAIPGYAAMGAMDRARALAARSGIDEASLLDAFVSDTPVLDVSRLQQLEQVRRRLRQQTLSSQGNRHALER